MHDETHSADAWQARLADAARRTGGFFGNVTVLAETESTQDAARELGAQPGHVVVAARQTAGRGRLGRAWADTGDKGVAVTFAVKVAPPERLSIASAVGVAGAIAPLVDRPVGIKWPNDVVVAGRKVAGILIEASGGLALIGVGVNVAQRDWPEEIAGRATSLHEMGATCDRVDVLAGLIASMAEALRLDDDALAAAYAPRDVLAGTHATFSSAAGGTVTGLVVRVEPLAGLVVETERGPVWLPAATTSVLGIGPPGGVSGA